MSPKELKPLRRDIQMIFQDPYSSLDPRMRVFDLIAEPFRANEHLSDEELHKAVCRLMDVVGLAARLKNAYPARVFRRPAPAHRHCPRAGPAPEAHHLRRAHLGAGCVDSGADSEFAGGPAERV